MATKEGKRHVQPYWLTLGISPRRRAAVRRETRKTLLGLLFISPWLVGFLWLTLYPMLASLYYSFTDYQILGDPVWVGWANYNELLFHDELFWVSVRNTLFFALLYLPLTTILGIALALLLNSKVRGMSVYRTLFYAPTVVPHVASIFLWVWLLNPRVGPINVLLGRIGIDGPGWLNDPDWTKPSLVLLGIWGAGTSVVIYLAGLQDIPAHLYEAAELDGAGWLRKTWNVTLPMLTPTILFNVLIGLIAAFQYFTQAFVAQTMTNTGNSLLFYNVYLFRNAFGYFRMGYASAMAWVLLVFVLVVTLALFRSTNRWVHYGR